MYRRILLCYDGTREGRNALREGAEVALSMRTEAHVLAVIRSTAGMAVPEGFNEVLFEGEDRTARQIMDEGLEWLRARGLTAEGHMVFGDPIEHIPAAARNLGVDLIVLGHRSRSRLARWWSDSEGGTLLDTAPCSILVSIVPAAGGQQG